MLAKSKSLSVVPRKTDIKERLEKLNALEKESASTIDEKSSEEDIETASFSLFEVITNVNFANCRCFRIKNLLQRMDPSLSG